MLNSGFPKYHHLKEILRERLVSLDAGQKVPSEAELCRRFGVSRTTVRRALDDLAREGLVYSLQGKGTFVAGRKVNTGWVQHARGFSTEMAERGEEVGWQMLEQGKAPASAEVARELELPLGEPVAQFVRLRYTGGQPYDLCINSVPLRLFPDILSLPWTDGSLYNLLSRHYGVRLVRGVRVLEVDTCTSKDGKLLGTRRGAALLVLRSTMFDAAGRPVEHGIARQRGDRVKLVIDVIPS